MKNAEDMNEFEALTAESMPAVRKVFKVVGMISFAFIWIAAMYMTLSAMIFRTEGQPWWVIFGMVALGIGADFWVGAGPVILRSSAKWGIRGWVAVGWITLIVALGFSFSNKLAYWVGTTDRQEAVQIASSVDHLEADRALVAQNPGARVPAAVRAERDAAELAISAKEAEIDSMPAEWPLRLRRAQRELLDLQTRYGSLSGEYETAVAVAEANERIDADRERSAIVAAGAQTRTDPMVEWVIGLFAAFGATLTAAQALIWLHAAYSLFHELAQFSFLGLATLRIPLHKMEEEQQFLVSQKRLHADKRVQMLSTEIDKLSKVKMAQAEFAATRKTIREIADAEAELVTMRKMRDIERRKRAFLMEESPYDIPEGRLVEDMRETPDPVAQKAREVIDAVIESGGSAAAAAAAARAATATTLKTEGAKDELSGDFIDYEQITYMRRKPQKKGEKLPRAEAQVKNDKRGPRKGLKRIWDKDGRSTEYETGVVHDGGARQATSAVAEEAPEVDLHVDERNAQNAEPAQAVDVDVVTPSPEARLGDEPQVSQHPEPSEEPPPLTELSEEQVNELLAELPADDLPVEPASSADPEPASDDEAGEEAAEKPLDHETLPEREEPETDPAKMIPANVAAE